MEIKPVNLKVNQSWIFIGRTYAEAEDPILWPSDSKNWLIGKDPNARKDWRQEEKGTTEDDMVEWHHWLDGYESEQAPGVGDGQGSLACCSPWGCKELDMTEWLNWTVLSHPNGRKQRGTKKSLEFETDYLTGHLLSLDENAWWIPSWMIQSKTHSRVGDFLPWGSPLPMWVFG